MLEKKYSVILVKDGKEALSRTIVIDIRTTAMEFYNEGERWGSIQNTALGKWKFITEGQDGGQWTENY